MGLWQFDNVRALLAVPDQNLRAVVRKSVLDHGLTMCRFANTVEQICHELRGGEVDLLITVPEISGADVGALVQQMRHNRIGENPFVIVITLIANPNPALVRRVVDAGVDDVLLMPSAASQVVGRLNNFVVGRKPFIVTHDYIGPERRAAEREGMGSAPSIVVPNPIRWQVIVNSEGESLVDQIREANARINVHKMKSYCAHISYLVGHIVAAYHAEDHANLRNEATKLGMVAEDLVLRTDGTSFTIVCELVNSMRALSARLARGSRTPRQEEVEILPPLSQAIQRAFDDDATSVAWTDLVSVV